ncbi:universal stress protein [Nocardioides sp. GY 10113]|uniref:universal stress protein n=1 Tax=Nocardioides sp. GY 10113 TaxID=2569761 RepID=UPI0010A76306|nr:universal stress protein [Nocardioides sp. GY 10113]TIC83248.1 universal stress protein [Nocardioides sp. GY 10113]
MHTNEIPVGTVAVGVDGSESSELAVAWAAEQAAAEARSLTLVHVINPVGAVWLDEDGHDTRGDRGTLEGAMTGAEKLIAAARDAALDLAPNLEVHSLIRVDDARSVLIEASERAACIVLGSRGRGPVRSLLLGSVGVAVTRHAACPVVILRPSEPHQPRHGVLVGVDATEQSRAPLEFAFRQAAQRGEPLTVLHAFGDVLATLVEPHLVSGTGTEIEEQRAVLAEIVAGMGEKYPDVQVTYELARGLAADSIIARAEGMDLVVVGSHHGGAASEFLLGSVAASVVEHAHRTVAIVPSGAD